MCDLYELYQDVILDHGQNPRYFGVMQQRTHAQEAYNPICGDRMTIYAQIVRQRFVCCQFSGVGCAISIASASLLMERVQDKTIQEVEHLKEKFIQMLMNGAQLEEMDSLKVFYNVRNFPSRVKCATLAWHGMETMMHTML